MVCVTLFSTLMRRRLTTVGLRVPPPPGTSRLKPSDVYAHSRSAGFGREVQKRILLGTYSLTAECAISCFHTDEPITNSDVARSTTTFCRHSACVRTSRLTLTRFFGTRASTLHVRHLRCPPTGSTSCFTLLRSALHRVWKGKGMVRRALMHICRM